MIGTKGNCARILDYLKKRSGITSKEAFEKFGVTRLSAIIFNLRQEGGDYGVEQEVRGMKWWYATEGEKKMPFMKWEKTSDGYKPIEITDEEMFDENVRRRGKRAKVWLDEANEMAKREKEKKMEFKKENVFTALNADELRAGDKVIVGNCVKQLKSRIESNIVEEIKQLFGEQEPARFDVGEDKLYALAYLVERAEREKMERISEQLEIVNDKNFDRIKDSIPVPKVEPVNCKDCDDTVCCERGKDKLAYCPRCFEKKDKKMEFDKSRVFTAVNADELKAGDKVIAAESLRQLKKWVGNQASAETIERILPDEDDKRFVVEEYTDAYSFAYLVERAELKTEQSCTKCRLATKLSDGTLACDVDGFPVDCTPPHDEACSDYKPKTEKKEMCLNCKHYNKKNDFRDCTIINNPTGACPHYEAEKKYRPFKDVDELIKVWDSKHSHAYPRPKGTMPLIWVRRKGDNSDKGSLITAYGKTTCIIAEVNLIGADMTRLFTEFEFLNGTPCGVEE